MKNNRTIKNLLPELPMATGVNTLLCEPKTNRQKEIELTIGRDASPVLKLNPPVFADVTESTRNRQPKFNRLIASVRRVL